MNEPNRKPALPADLLGYHLGLCDEEDRRRVEAAVTDAKALAAARRALDRILSPLDADETPEPPTDLVESVLARVRDAQRTIPFPKRAAASLPAPMDVGERGSSFNLRELVGLAAAILLFVGVFVPGYRTARGAAQRAMCANNMRLLGNGYEGYAETFGNALPYVRGVPAGATWLPTNRAGIQRFTNTPNTYILVSKRFVPPSAFVCPGREQDRPLITEDPEALHDFPDSHNNSYSTIPITESWQQRDFDPRMPLAADMNPMVDKGAAQDMRIQDIPENSLSHGGGRGQNVLRGNISVTWSTTPRVGVDNDDIYRLIGVKTYTGREWPRLRSDAFLIP